MVNEPIGALVGVKVEMKQGVDENVFVGAHRHYPAQGVDPFLHGSCNQRVTISFPARSNNAVYAHRIAPHSVVWAGEWRSWQGLS